MNRADLAERGFTGWIPLLAAAMERACPAKPGVYAVAYDVGRPTAWPDRSCGGWHKGRDPTVTVEQLDRKWVDGTDIVYLGKTDRTLAQRIAEFARFGRGEAVPHWGGRLIWQLPEVERLLIGWRPLEAGAATLEENMLLLEFAEIFGCLPFANLRR